MKTVKRSKVYLLVVAFVLVLSMTVGLTMAYFSDHTEAKGVKQIALGGQTRINEQQRDNEKLITIENFGDTDVVVRVAVYGPTEIKYELPSDWTRITKEGRDYVYYTKVLPAKTRTSQIRAYWDVPADIGDDFNVVVIQESDQAVYYANGTVVTPATTPAWDFSDYPKAN